MLANSRITHRLHPRSGTFQTGFHSGFFIFKYVDYIHLICSIKYKRKVWQKTTVELEKQESRFLTLKCNMLFEWP